MIGVIAVALLQAGSVQGAQPIDVTLNCPNPIGSSAYMPGGLVTKEMALKPSEDGFTGQVLIMLKIGENVKIDNVIWVRNEQTVSAKSDGLISETYLFESGTIRADIFWGNGGTDSILLSNSSSSQPSLAYTSIITGSRLERIGYYVAQCSRTSP
ncbi:hypothetical protein MCEMIH15_01908 [Caulobacteraceae bacterium]